MPFLKPPSRRLAAELLLVVSLLCFLVYDITDTPNARSNSPTSMVYSYERKPSSSAPDSHTSPAASSSLASLSRDHFRNSPVALLFSSTLLTSSSSRFGTAVSGNVTDTFTVCVGNSFAPSSPWVIGENGKTQALVVSQSAECSLTPRILFNGSNAAVTVKSFSWLSFQDIQNLNSFVTTGPVTAEPGSNVEFYLSKSLVADPKSRVIYTVIKADGACPNLNGVNANVYNCPVDATLSTVGSYACLATAVGVGSQCAVSVEVVGPLTSSAGQYIQMIMNKDCATFTQTQFAQTIQAATGVPAQAIWVVVWTCGSIATTFTVLGNPALATAALNQIFTSASSGALSSALGVTSVSVSATPTPPTPPTPNPYNSSYPYNYNNSYPYNYTNRSTTTTTTTSTTSPKMLYFPTASSSNPALWALMTLLLIPIGIAIGLILWCCMKKKDDSSYDSYGYGGTTGGVEEEPVLKTELGYGGGLVTGTEQQASPPPTPAFSYPDGGTVAC